MRATQTKLPPHHSDMPLFALKTYRLKSSHVQQQHRDTLSPQYCETDDTVTSLLSKEQLYSSQLENYVESISSNNN